MTLGRAVTSGLDQRFASSGHCHYGTVIVGNDYSASTVAAAAKGGGIYVTKKCMDGTSTSLNHSSSII
jgi:hypothetical protein